MRGRVPRAARRLFLQPPDRLERPVRAFALRDAWSRGRVLEVGRSFLAGYNAMAAADDPDEVHVRLATLEPYLRPFGYEGAAMGFGPWALMHGERHESFEGVLGTLSPATVYQNYVGWGWWLGLRYRGRRRPVEAIAAGLDARYALLVYEGIGFRAGFLSAGDRRVLERFAGLDEPARHVVHQGFGRSLWFAHMGDPGAAVREIERLPQHVRGDGYSGLGLGCAYSWLDRAAVLPGVAAQLPRAARHDFLQGAAFGWEARHRADPELFARLTGDLPEGLRRFIAAALAAVQDARAAMERSGNISYQTWRAATRERIDSAIPTEGVAHVV